MENALTDLKAESIFFHCLKVADNTILREDISRGTVSEDSPTFENIGIFDERKQKVFYRCIELSLKAQSIGYKSFVEYVVEQKKKARSPIVGRDQAIRPSQFAPSASPKD